MFSEDLLTHFTAMYLLSTILNTPSPPVDLLLSRKEVSTEGVAIEPETAEAVKVETVGKTEKRVNRERILL